MTTVCPAGVHPIRSSQDKYSNGMCRECCKAKNRAHRQKQKQDLAAMRAALEERGIQW